MIKTSPTLPLIGYASGIAGNDPGCGDGPGFLQNHQFIEALAAGGLNAYWLNTISPGSDINKSTIKTVADLSNRLAEETEKLSKQHQRFVVIGGDHSSAIGTWSGVASAYQTNGTIGLIWIDAHLDSHTFETSETGNIHGMPVACLLGYGDPMLKNMRFSKPKILPQNLTIIGARSFEHGEQELIKRLGVRVFYQDELNVIGIKAALAQARARATNNTVGYGMSIDIDAIDPGEAPGVGTPAKYGIKSQDLLMALADYAADETLLGIEFAEFNPHHDREGKTKDILAKLLLALAVRSKV